MHRAAPPQRRAGCSRQSDSAVLLSLRSHPAAQVQQAWPDCSSDGAGCAVLGAGQGTGGGGWRETWLQNLRHCDTLYNPGPPPTAAHIPGKTWCKIVVLKLAQSAASAPGWRPPGGTSVCAPHLSIYAHTAALPPTITTAAVHACAMPVAILPHILPPGMSPRPAANLACPRLLVGCPLPQSLP